MEVRTLLLNNKNRCFSTARESANQSKYANKQAKVNFFNAVNSTMNNHQISPKKKFNILNNLLRKNKSSSVPPLIENGETVTDAKNKSEILNTHFTQKASVDGFNDTPPKLDKHDVFSSLDQINTIVSW